MNTSRNATLTGSRTEHACTRLRQWYCGRVPSRSRIPEVRRLRRGLFQQVPVPQPRSDVLTPEEEATQVEVLRWNRFFFGLGLLIWLPGHVNRRTKKNGRAQKAEETESA